MENLAFLIDNFFKLKQSCPFKKNEYRDITVEEIKEHLKDSWRSIILYQGEFGYEFQFLQERDKNEYELSGDLKYIPKGSSWYDYRGWGRNSKVNYNTISFEEATKKFKQKVEVYENGTAVHVS